MTAPSAAPTSTAPNQSRRPFGLKDKIAYAMGDFGNDMTFMIQAMFLMVYFTKVIGIDPVHVGLLVAAARVLDAFVDVGVGRFVDTRIAGPDGKFRPWIKRVAIPVALFSALLYLPITASWAYPAKVAWMTIFYVFWGVCYSAINIPYGSMASVISPESSERAQLSVWRSTGAQIAYLLVTTLLPIVAFSGKNVLPWNFAGAGIAMAVIAVVMYYGLYSLSVERVAVPPKESGEGHGFGDLLKSLATNRALLAIIVAALLLLLGNLFNGTVASYIWLDYFGSGALQGAAGLAAALPPFLLVPVAGALVKRFGKAEVAIVGTLLYVAVMLLQFFLHTKDPVLFIVLNAIAMFGIAVFNFLIWAMIVDVIDFEEVRTGSRDDGTIYGLYSWARKVGQALSIGLGGVALGLIGYQTGAGVTQTPATVDGVWMLYNLVPALFIAGTALALIFWYPLKKATVKENERILAERRGALA